MFWIGFAIGGLTLAAVCFAYFAFCMWVTGISFDEFGAVVQANAAAFGNRESVMQVYHDGELLEEVVLKEKE